MGYLVTPRLLAYAGLDIAKQAIDVAGLDGDFGLTHLEAGARLSFPIARSKAMPYVGAWVGRRSLSTTVDNFDTGSQLGSLAVGHGGGGERRSAGVRVAQARARRRAQRRRRARWGTSRWTAQRQDWGTPDNTTTTRLRFGANWYP